MARFITVAGLVRLTTGFALTVTWLAMTVAWLAMTVARFAWLVTWLALTMAWFVMTMAWLVMTTLTTWAVALTVRLGNDLISLLTEYMTTNCRVKDLIDGPTRCCVTSTQDNPLVTIGVAIPRLDPSLTKGARTLEGSSSGIHKVVDVHLGKTETKHTTSVLSLKEWDTTGDNREGSSDAIAGWEV